jgi:hypothetical protein
MTIAEKGEHGKKKRKPVLRQTHPVPDQTRQWNRRRGRHGGEQYRCHRKRGLAFSDYLLFCTTTGAATCFITNEPFAIFFSSASVTVFLFLCLVFVCFVTLSNARRWGNQRVGETSASCSHACYAGWKKCQHESSTGFNMTACTYIATIGGNTGWYGVECE